nr:2-phosphosulfolactate phosphatase [Candidatus Sigynarchaeota archaeon]
MNIEITWGDDLPAIPRNKNCICVVIDVLRASTSVAMLLHRGARAVKIVRTVDEALALKRSFPGAILCGERGGLPPAGFDYGNSPVEFSTADVSKKDVILTTTNFTRIAVEAISKEFPSVYCCAFVNRSAVAGIVRRKATAEGRDVLLVAAGTKQDAFEDLACAMHVAKYIEVLHGDV